MSAGPGPRPLVHGVSAVVVHYRGGEAFRRCLAACLRSGIGEILVIDNEGVAERLREDWRDARVRVFAGGRNAGFGAAANAGLSAASTDAVLVLNQDVEIGAPALDAMLTAATASGAWLVGPRLVDGRGELWPHKSAFPGRLERPVATARGDGWRQVPWIAGAVMLFAPGHTGLRFDERLFMYVEDEELCWRAWRDGGSVVLAERAVALHLGGTASRARWSRRAITARTIANRTRMVRWHAGAPAAVRYVASTLAGAAARRAG